MIANIMKLSSRLLNSRDLFLLLIVSGLFLPAASLASDKVQVPSDREVRFVLPVLWIVSAEERQEAPESKKAKQSSVSVVIHVLPDRGIQLTSDRKAEFLDPAMPTGTKLALVRAGESTELYCEVIGTITRPRRCFGDSMNSGTLDYICLAYGTGGKDAATFRDYSRYGVLGLSTCVELSAKNRPNYVPLERSAFDQDEFIFRIGEGYGDWNYWISWAYVHPDKEIMPAGFSEFKFSETDTVITKQFGGLSLSVTKPEKRNAVATLALESVDREVPLGCFISGFRGGILQAVSSETLFRDELAMTRLRSEASSGTE